MSLKHKGDGNEFDQNWKSQSEAHYLHWTRSEPINQIQYAFRQHWNTFQEIIGPDLAAKRIAEIGCGRGSLSAYFADHGCDCTLLDISEKAIALAKKAFQENDIKANFEVGDCLSLPFDDGSYDVVFSIGLLEHFEDTRSVLAEQLRVLKSGGYFIGYIVPNIPDNIQKEYNWICDILECVANYKPVVPKVDVFRSDLMSGHYVTELQDLGLEEICSSGIYPLPMISYSIEFPFTLLPPDAELKVVSKFEDLMRARRLEIPGVNPWLCAENEGQAILVWGKKP